jgi:hypothetical protein
MAWYTESCVTITPGQTSASSSSALTTSPARAARFNSSRKVRGSSRTVWSPCVIWPNPGSTNQAPTRRFAVAAVSIQTFDLP